MPGKRATDLLHRNRRAAIALLVLGIAVSAGLVAYQLLKRPGDVHNQAAISHFEPQKPKAPPKKARTVNWPIYGLNPARTRYLPARGIAPPFRKLWRHTQRPLLEFPPIYVAGRLYVVNNNANAFALDAETGKVLWERQIGRLNASSPAYYKHRLYIVNLEPAHIVKLDAKTGRALWRRDLPGRAESSPLVIDGTVYFGCESGELFALNARNGHTRWVTQLGGAIKAAPAYYGGKLFVGDYGGHMNAVDAKTGKLVWQSGSLGPGLGASGQFYSTPAVAYGRVYAGNTDGRVYSYDSGDGELAWSFSTGGYVYSSPVVANTRHTAPTVYIGSFDGNVYAINAKDGSLRWERSAGGQVVGSLAAVGDIVYVSEFTNKTTTGFMMRSGRRVWRYPKGTYTPVISDGRRLYLTGYSSITALQPITRAEIRKARARRVAHRAALAKRRAAHRRALAKRRVEATARRRRRAGAAAPAAGSGHPAQSSGRAASGGGP